MRKYLIIQSSNTPGNKVFIDTFPKLEDSLELINYQRTPHWDKNVPNSLIIRLDSPYRTHIDKFLGINTVFLDDGYVFHSDTADVIFQAPVPQSISGDIIVCSEGVTHDGEPNHGSFWRKQVPQGDYYEKLMDKTIYNAGLFAMRTEVFRDFLEFFNKELEQRRVTPFIDQLILNDFIHFHFKGNITENTDIMMCGYKNIELGRMKKEGVWKNEKGNTISICHFNGNSKQYEDIFNSNHA